jgi:hypothetical protein
MVQNKSKKRFGYHRKSWYVLMAFLATVLWLLNALLAFIGIPIPMIYLSELVRQNIDINLAKQH